MLTTKNLSPRQLSLYTSLLISIPAGLGFWLVSSLFIAAIAFVVIVGIAFFLIHYTLQRFIYRKIKLIYKFIYQTKATKKEELYYKYLLPKKSIDEVREDVEQWATQQKQEIEVLKSNEAFRKEFLQNLSHEFKTPVFAIQGYVDTLLDGAIDNAAVNKKFLENANRNIERLVSLLNELDEISKLESGEQALHKSNFIIQHAIKEVYDSLSIEAAKRNIHCSIKKGCEQPVMVYADKEKIKQVLINLVSNAIKYGRDSGHIVASIYKTDEKHVLVEISDDGMGISEEHLPRIFERFYRTDPGRSRNAGGAGLGLSICKHIIEAHGQNIHVRSKVDVGTTVGFTLGTK